ncbi:MAG: MFS transporter [Clostridia bacterium]
MGNRNKTFLFSIVTSFYWFSLYAYVPTLSTYVESLGASYKMVGLVVGSYGFTQMLLRIPLGILSDRLNKRKLFVILGIVLALISSIGLWLFPHVGLTLFFRALAGTSAAAWVVFTVLYSSYYEDSSAPKAIGILNSYNFAGQMTSIFLGGLAAQFFSQQASFFVAVIGGVIALILSFGIQENKSIQRKPLGWSDILSVATDRTLLVVSGLSILSQFITFSTMYGFNPVIAKNLGATNFELSILTNLATIPVIFASLLSVVFSKYFGEKKTVMLGFTIAALSTMAVPYMPNIPWLYFMQLVGGIGRGLTFPLLMGLSIKNIDGSRRATAMGFFQSIYGVGMFIGPIILGFFSDTIGMTFGYWFTGLIGIIGAGITYRCVRSSKQIKD